MACMPRSTLRWHNLAASAFVVAFACLAYGLAPTNRRQMESLFGTVGFTFTGAQFLGCAAVLYVCLLAGHYLSERTPAESKSLRALLAAGRFVASPGTTWRSGLDPVDQVAVLATLLKAFFGPLMVMALLGFCAGAIGNGLSVLADTARGMPLATLFDHHGFWFLMQLILFVDVLLFTLGYLIELPRLGNEIRSVDPTILGWAAALACYPPFNLLTAELIGSQSSDFPRFDDPTAHLLLNAALLALMATYASASVALGFKASNLTHRGIVARGPYAFVRHPAYTAKNLAWWIGAIPAVDAALGHSPWAAVQAIASVAGVTLLYVLRALTEEDHLRRVDGEYAAYAAHVRYRFIPRVI